MLHSPGRRWTGRGPTIITLVCILVLAGGTYAIAASQAVPSTTINACKTVLGLIRVVDGPDDCRRNETPLSWNTTGPQGPAGPQGPPGEDGVDGAPGEDPRFGDNTGFADSSRPGWEGCYIGQVQLWAGFGAQGIVANGQLLPVIEFKELTALFGTTYGGDGSTTVGVPDLQSAAPNGTTYTICAKGIFPTPS